MISCIRNTISDNPIATSVISNMRVAEDAAIKRFIMNEAVTHPQITGKK